MSHQKLSDSDSLNKRVTSEDGKRPPSGQREVPKCSRKTCAKQTMCWAKTLECKKQYANVQFSQQ